jgi:hypothetical protein
MTLALTGEAVRSEVEVLVVHRGRHETDEVFAAPNLFLHLPTEGLFWSCTPMLAASVVGKRSDRLVIAGAALHGCYLSPTTDFCQIVGWCATCLRVHRVPPARMRDWYKPCVGCGALVDTRRCRTHLVAHRWGRSEACS